MFSGYNWLCNLLASNKRFDYIDLEDNSIQTGGGTAIPDFITKNPSLQKLCLTKNNLNDEDATLISLALKHNTNLKWIHLERNGITEIGERALTKAIYDPTSLNSVADSNHTVCRIDGFNGNVEEFNNRPSLPDMCKNTGGWDPKSTRV